MNEKATDTLLPESIPVTLGEETVTLKTFVLAKTLRVFAALGEVAEALGLGSVLGAVDESASAGEFARPIASGFISRLISILPLGLATGTPSVYRLIGLLVTSNRDLQRLEEGEEDVDAALLRRGRELAYQMTNAQAIELVNAAVRLLGVENVRGNLTGLLQLFRR